MSIASLIANPSVQRFIWSALRTVAPVFKFKNTVLISRYDHVLEILKRDQEFTISEVNGKRMGELGLSFFLGMDTSDQHDNEFALMAKVIKREDLVKIQNLVAQKAEELIMKAKPEGRIDVVNEYARVVPLYLLEAYFGIPVLDENKMKHWMRILFHHLFLNLNDDQKVKTEAMTAAAELKAYFEALITTKKIALQNGELLEDNVLNRLLQLQKDNLWITDDVIRRNISGFIIGSVDTTSKTTVLVMEELLKRTDELKKTQSYAVKNDIPVLGKYMLEALRFNPHNPIVLRYCKSEMKIGSESKTYKIPAGSTIYVGIISAMFDKKSIPNPKSIDLDRKTEYLHFSFGLHACAGRYINMVQIPELMAGLLKLNNLRRPENDERNIKSDGPFPDRFILEFDK